MPASASGSLSAASAASHRSPTRPRYRTKAVSSEVDESLFGMAKNLPRSCTDSPLVILRNVQTVQKSPSACGWGHKPETIRLITRDLIRDLVVPAEDPSGESLIMSPEDFHRIKAASQVLTKEEREANVAALKAEREALIAGVNERKHVMKQKGMVQKKKEKLSDLEEEAKERAQYLLQRATRMRMEQEEEVKELSEMILNAKCQAIRDAQMLEKQLIEKELGAEEKRLDQMMEVERQKATKMQEELEQKRKQEMIRGKQHIIEQIEKNQEERAMKAEQRDQEAQEMLDYLEQMQMEDMRDMENRHEQRMRIQAEVKRINDENQRRKEEQLAQERMADLQVLEYQKQKMAREAEFEAEQERIRREKEMETARLRALQEKAQDYQAEQDALRAKRNQEATEREWRRKEKEAAQKKAETDAMLKKSRLEQIVHKEHSLAVQVQRDRNEFERILRAQREQIEKERKEQERRTALQLTHADEVRRQVREHQQKQIQERITTFEEGRRLKEEARRRSERINEIKRKKMEELRAAGLPEKYCAQVERRAVIEPAPVH